MFFYAKHKRLPFQDSSSVSLKPFNLIHMDIWEPFSIPSMNGHKYFLTFIDDHTRYCCIFLMKLKFEASLLVQSFTKFAKTQFNTTIKVIGQIMALNLL